MPSHTVNDFDFLVGTWNTRQRRLKKRLCGNQEWEEFPATVAMQKLPGDVSNFDTMVADTWRPGWVGMALRIYNPATDLWSIFWFTNDGGGLDEKTGTLSQPVVGKFHGDEGFFECDDSFEGAPIRVRYHWTRISANAARWQQSFSPDGGKTWEMNWVADFERRTAATGVWSV